MRAEVFWVLGRLSVDAGDAWGLDFFIRAGKIGARVGHVPLILDATTRRRRAFSEVSVAEQAIRRRGWGATVIGDHPGWRRLLWPAQDSSVNNIIPTRDPLDLLQTAVDGVLTGTHGKDVRLVIVENASTDPFALVSLRTLERSDRASLLRVPGEFNFSKLCNAAARSERPADVLVFLNNDVEIIHPEWLTQLVGWFSDPAVAASGPKLLFSGRKIQHTGVVMASAALPATPDGPARTPLAVLHTLKWLARSQR